MKLTIDRTTLQKSLARIARVVERRNTIPILSNILLSAQNGALRMKATDLDIEISESIEANIGDEGTTTVPALLLSDIARKLPDGEVSLALDKDGQFVTMKSGRSSFKLQCLPPEDFPAMTSGTFSHIFRIDGAKMKWLLDSTWFAVSTEETRYYLNGIYFHVKDSGGLKLRAVATDGHRLARAEMEAPDGSQSMPGVIIPRKTVAEIAKLVDASNEVLIELSDTKIRFEIGGVILTSKLIDGTFPDYDRVIPAMRNKVAIADRKARATAADRVATVSSERGRAVKLGVDAGVMTLSVSSPENGSAEEEMSVDYGADRIEVGFNVNYLKDVLGVIDGDNARIYLDDPGSPTIFTGEKDNGFLAVLMPMRV